MRNIITAILWPAVLLLGVPAWPEGAKSHYDIPPQALASALRSLADTGDLQLVFEPDVVAGKQTQGIKGEYTALEALRILITPSGLPTASMARTRSSSGG